MRRSCVLYGSKTMTVNDLAAAVAAALGGARTRLHTSDALGDYVRILYEPEPRKEEIRVGPNHVPYEGQEELETLENDYRDYPAMVWVDLTTREDEIQRRLAAIPGLDLLRREELDWPS